MIQTLKKIEKIIDKISMLYSEKQNKGWSKTESYDSSVKQVFNELGKLPHDEAKILCEMLEDYRQDWGIDAIYR